jgi:hypothetical protein
MAPEENLCRRSNLVATLNDAKGHHSNNYPIPPRGGIYSQHVGKHYFFLTHSKLANFQVCDNI